MIDLRTPVGGFDENTYLRSNPDVAAAVQKGEFISGWQHVLIHGHHENRLGLSPAVKTEVLDYWQKLEKSEGRRIPPPALRERVHGAPDFSSFYLVGNRIAGDIDGILAEHNIVPRTGSHVFDFGCGCGRVIRHMKQRHGGWKMTGSDIDAEAIAWCRENLGDVAKFVANAPWPPLPLEPSSFDFIYAISVFTHLPEDMQFAWLDELRRVAKPGGVLCLSTHPFTLAPDTIDKSIRDRGFLYSVAKGTSGLPDFYQTAFHSRAYILQKWSDYFEVVDVMSNRINRHQDVVVLRKRR